MTAQKPLTDMALFRKKVKVTIHGQMAGTAYDSSGLCLLNPIVQKSIQHLTGTKPMIYAEIPLVPDIFTSLELP